MRAILQNSWMQSENPDIFAAQSMESRSSLRTISTPLTGWRQQRDLWRWLGQNRLATHLSPRVFETQARCCWARPISVNGQTFARRIPPAAGAGAAGSAEIL